MELDRDREEATIKRQQRLGAQRGWKRNPWQMAPNGSELWFGTTKNSNLANLFLTS